MQNNDIVEEILKNKKSLNNEIKIRLEESKFGVDMVSPFLNKLKPNSNILKIVPGPCLLLLKITEKYPEINTYLIERLDTDEKFRKKQNFFRLPGQLFRKTGILEGIYKMKWFRNYLPFMFMCLFIKNHKATFCYF